MLAISNINFRWLDVCQVLFIVRAFFYPHLLKSLRVAITTNHISLSLPQKEVSFLNWWYLLIPQLVLIIFGLDILSNTLCIFYEHVSGIHALTTTPRQQSRFHWIVILAAKFANDSFHRLSLPFLSHDHY